MTHEEIHELAAAYALDILDAGERDAFAAHLEECARCRDEVAALADPAAALALAHEAAESPPALRERVLAAVAQEAAAVTPIAAGRARRRPALRRPLLSLVAAAAVAALSFGVWQAVGPEPGSTLAWSVQLGPGRMASLAVRGLDRAPAGKVYAVWVIDGSPKPAGLFAGGEDAEVMLTRPVPRGAVVAVTLERAGGSRVPTPPILLQTAAVA